MYLINKAEVEALIALYQKDPSSEELFWKIIALTITQAGPDDDIPPYYQLFQAKFVPGGATLSSLITAINAAAIEDLILIPGKLEYVLSSKHHFSNLAGVMIRWVHGKKLDEKFMPDFLEVFASFGAFTRGCGKYTGECLENFTKWKAALEA